MKAYIYGLFFIVFMFITSCHKHKTINIRQFATTVAKDKMNFIEHVLNNKSVYNVFYSDDAKFYINGKKIDGLCLNDSLKIRLSCSKDSIDTLVNNILYLKSLNLTTIKKFYNEGKCTFWGYYYGDISDCIPCDDILIRLNDDFDSSCINRYFTIRGEYNGIIWANEGSPLNND